jgi:hypothetical protein
MQKGLPGNKAISKEKGWQERKLENKLKKPKVR